MSEGTTTVGRPSIFSPELAERICALVASGSSIGRIAKMEGYPSDTTILRWLAQEGPDFDAFRAMYARAREFRADARFESIDDILDELRAKKVDPQAARVMIDAIKWQASKERPRSYGDAVTLKGDKDAPLSTPRDLTDEELAALAAGGLRAR